MLAPPCACPSGRPSQTARRCWAVESLWTMPPSATSCQHRPATGCQSRCARCIARRTTLPARQPRRGPSAFARSDATSVHSLLMSAMPRGTACRPKGAHPRRLSSGAIGGATRRCWGSASINSLGNPSTLISRTLATRASWGRRMPRCRAVGFVPGPARAASSAQPPPRSRPSTASPASSAPLARRRLSRALPEATRMQPTSRLRASAPCARLGSLA